jgi:TonB family protein
LLLAHELAHIKRYDYVINLLQSLIEVFLFFHPAVKWISQQVRVDREFCCDDLALKLCPHHMSYAHTLLEAEQLRPINIPQMAMAATGGDLTQRVKRIIGQHSCPPTYTHRGIAALIGFITITLLFIAINQSSQPIEPVIAVRPLPTLTPEAHNIVNFEVIAKTPTLDPLKLDEQPIKMIKPKTGSFSKKQLTAHNKIINHKKNIYAKPLDKSSIRKATVLNIEKTDIKKISIIKPTKINEKQLLTQISHIAPITSNSINDSTISNTDNATNTVSNMLNRQLAKKATSAPLIIPPSATKMIVPSYPKTSLKRGHRGDVVVSFTVNLAGKAENIKFINSTRLAFKKSIRHALKKWEFEPGKINGHLTAMTATKLFDFSHPIKKSDLITTGTRLIRN